jgi:hypothetical protein
MVTSKIAHNIPKYYEPYKHGTKLQEKQSQGVINNCRHTIGRYFISSN